VGRHSQLADAPDVVVPLPRLPAPTLVGGVTHGRAARRLEQRRRQVLRRRIAGGLVAVAAVGVSVQMLLQAGGAAPHPRAVTAFARTQTTLLLTVDVGTDHEGALVAADPRASSASVTLLPSRVIASVPGRGQLPLGQALGLSDAGQARATVSDLLDGVRVDSSWKLSGAALAKLIDAVGGVVVDVDTTVNSGGGVLASPGSGQRLTGAVAVAYADTLDGQEVEASRLARLQRVLDALIAGLPSDGSRLGALVGSLGGGSVSTLAPARLAQLLHTVSVVRAAGSSGPVFSLLPVQPVDAGGATPAYRTDPVALRSYLQSTLAASLPRVGVGPPLNVYVYNGVGTPNLGSTVREVLVAHGLRFAGSGNETTFGRATSVVLVHDATSASRAAGQRVAAALGLPASSVGVSTRGADVADIVVLIGADYGVHQPAH
jgi:hypothetical protein